ncbi:MULTISPECIES: hypothetical protein, partial [Bacteria]|jgi:hypothetical protein|uniref:Uncharacterized protein n=1 Tax=Myoviridae sp. ctu2j3 TaxID=2825197 RepID=A0A8S5UIJ1_9CAUD
MNSHQRRKSQRAFARLAEQYSSMRHIVLRYPISVSGLSVSEPGLIEIDWTFGRAFYEGHKNDPTTSA